MSLGTYHLRAYAAVDADQAREVARRIETFYGYRCSVEHDASDPTNNYDVYVHDQDGSMLPLLNAFVEGFDFGWRRLWDK